MKLRLCYNLSMILWWNNPELDSGFTLVEVMIFLAVSSLMLGSGVVAISGRRAAAELTTSVHDFESRIQDLANDVSTGNYAASGAFGCQASGSTVRINSTPTPTGTNKDCILVGQLIAFDKLATDSGSITVASLAGLRTDPLNGMEVTSMKKASPQPITNGATESIGPLQIKKVTYNNGAGDVNVTAIALVTTFGKYASSALSSSDISVDIMPLDTSGPVSNIFAPNNINTALSAPSAVINPSGGVAICVEGGNNKKATIGLGTNGGTMTTSLVFGVAPC